jgi:hypothetical protein
VHHVQSEVQRVAKRLAARVAKIIDAAGPASPLEHAVGRRVTGRPAADAYRCTTRTGAVPAGATPALW